MVKCLKALAWYKREVTMAEIAKKAGLKDVTTVRTAIGSANPEISETIAKKYHKGSSCLLDNGMVRHVKHEDARATLYAITAKGLKAVKDI